MAAVAEVRTFWSALLSVLLKCIAALGFTTPARTAAARTEVAGAAGTKVSAAALTEATAANRGGRAAAAPPGAGRGPVVPLPAPRAYEPLRALRGRTLPPTMKQRISAEAHGSSPSARSLPAGNLLDDGFAGALTVPAPSGRHLPGARAGSRTAAGANASAGTCSGTGTGTTGTRSDDRAGVGVGAGAGAVRTSLRG